MSQAQTIPTAHIEAKAGEIAKTVLMPGDPLRAKFIAETFLDNPVQFNGVRGMLGFTGTYKGVRVSVMGSGMGAASIGIYSYELFKFYDVENIIRVGTAGGIGGGVKLKDVVIGMAASTDSNYLYQYGFAGGYAPVASYELLETAVGSAKELGTAVKVGNIMTSDIFYHDNPEAYRTWEKMGILSVEMEAAALYANAVRLGKNALAILTVSDMIFTGEATTSEERQTTFTAMLKVGLETAAKLG
ncbi:MAG: purine-nucleoside phosphorylase [Defluviitaleaceae bacterium]|nr:purine-nucleoside phosphorylase [Defluviitaleaceae bacterium]